MPSWRAASIRFVPGATSISLPSMVSFITVPGGGLRVVSFRDEGLEFGTEFFDVGDVGADGAVEEGADGRAGPALGEVEDGVEIVLAAVAVHDPVGHLVDPARGLPARCALATALVGVEARHHHEGLGDGDRLVEDNHPR